MGLRMGWAFISYFWLPIYGPKVYWIHKLLLQVNVTSSVLGGVSRRGSLWFSCYVRASVVGYT